MALQKKQKSGMPITTLVSNPTWSRTIRYAITGTWTYTTNDLMCTCVAASNNTTTSYYIPLLACAQIDRIVVWTAGKGNTSLTVLGGEWGADKEWTSVSNETFPGHISVVPPRTTNASWMWKFRDLTWASPVNLFKVASSFTSGTTVYVDVHVHGFMHQGEATLYLTGTTLSPGIYYGVTAGTFVPVGLGTSTITNKTNI